MLCSLRCMYHIIVIAWVALCLSVGPAFHAHARLQEKAPQIKTLPELPSALYLNDFQTEQDAIEAWQTYQFQVPVLHLFHPVSQIHPENGRIQLIAMIEKTGIPKQAADQILQDTCAGLRAAGHMCTTVALEMRRAVPNDPETSSFKDPVDTPADADIKTDLPPLQSNGPSLPPSNPKPTPENNAIGQAPKLEAELTVSQAAIKAAYEVVKSRYEAVLAQAQITDEAHAGLIQKEGAQLTQNALRAAADQAFDRFLSEYHQKDIFEGQTYEGVRGQFLKAFEHAALKSMSAIGKTFVQDLTADDRFKTLSIKSELLNSIDEHFANAMIESGLTLAHNSQYAFLRHLEVSYKIREGFKPEVSLVTIQPIFSSPALKHNVFVQGAFSRQDSRNNLSAGIAYRYMPTNEDYVIGANAFLDYQHPYGHQRASLGLDYQRSLWGVSANYYKGLSQWRDARPGFEERPLDGHDIEIVGRMPFLPGLQVAGRTYRWQSFEQKDISGHDMKIEYTPVPAFTLEASFTDEKERDSAFGLGLRYNYIFGAPPAYQYDWNEQFRQKSAAEYLFSKVRRDNIIRVEERRKPNTTETVAPGLSATSPVDDATGLSVGINVSLSFENNIQAGAGDIIFTDLTDGSDTFTIPVGDPRVTIAGDMVSIDLSARLFEFLTDYELTFASGVFEDTNGNAAVGLSSGGLNFQTVVDPTAGFPAPTASVAPNTTSSSFEDAQDIGTWRTIIDVGASPDGVIFESGATGQGIAASFGGGNLVFGAGDGSSSSTNADTIFGSVPISSIPQGRHHFVFVADPDAPAEIGLYIDGIRVISESILGAMQSGEWAGTNGAGYGLVNSSIRVGVDTSNLSGATLISNLDFFTNVAPADF